MFCIVADVINVRERLTGMNRRCKFSVVDSLIKLRIRQEKRRPSLCGETVGNHESGGKVVEDQAQKEGRIDRDGKLIGSLVYMSKK